MNDTHPEPAEIAALDADLLEPEDAARLRDHLAGCADCTEVHRDFDLLSRELGDIPSPPMPADVTARINAALEVEAERAAHVSRETRRHARRWPRLALAAAAALVLLGLGGALLDSVRETVEPGATADAGSHVGGGDAAERGAPPLRQQVYELLARTDDSPTALDHQPEEAASPQSSPRHEDGDQTGEAKLPACVRAALDRSDAPLTAGEGDYEGQRSHIVVYPHRGDPSRVDAYVVADCTTGEEASQILTRVSYPRP